MSQIHRLSQGILNRPSFDASSKRVVVDSQFYRPVANAMSFAIKSNQIQSAFVAALFAVCRPPAITGFVISVVIWVSINRMPGRRTFTHIRKEVLKRFKPTVAYFYAPTAIIFIAQGVSIQASVFQRLPAFIFRRFVHPVLHSFAAAARFCKTHTKVLGKNYFGYSALAKAIPSSAPVARLCGFQNRKPAKLLSSEIDSVRVYPSHLTFTPFSELILVRPV